MTSSDSSGDPIVATVDPLVLFPTSLAENQAGQLPPNNTIRIDLAREISDEAVRAPKYIRRT